MMYSSSTGNSGLIRTGEVGDLRRMASKMTAEVLPENAIFPVHISYKTAPNENKSLNPAGEWNRSMLVFRGNHGEHWLNGKKVVDFDLGTPRMDSLLAKSKYRSIKDFAQRRAGHIVLQDHGDEVYFRNIRIRKLD